jgi:cyclic AMP-dependent transcription factor ATF-4
VRKLQYISELERSVTSLQVRITHSIWSLILAMDAVNLTSREFLCAPEQTEVSALSPRVAFLDHQRSLLTLGNSHLKQRIAALAQDKIFKDGDRHCRPPLAATIFTVQNSVLLLTPCA